MSVGVVAEEEEEDWEEALEEMDTEATEDGRQERREMSPMELLNIPSLSSHEGWHSCYTVCSSCFSANIHIHLEEDCSWELV